MGIFGRGSHNSNRRQSGNLVQKRQFKKEKKERVLKSLEMKNETSEELLHPEKFGKEIGTVVMVDGVPSDWKTGEPIVPVEKPAEVQAEVDHNEWRMKFLAETREAIKARQEESKSQTPDFLFNLLNPMKVEKV